MVYVTDGEITATVPEYKKEGTGRWLRRKKEEKTLEEAFSELDIWLTGWKTVKPP